MDLVDSRKERYQVIPYVHSLMGVNGTLQVYTFSERLLGYEYGNDSLMSPRGHEDFESHLGLSPFSKTRTENLEDILERKSRERNGGDRIELVWTLTPSTPEIEISRRLHELTTSEPDDGWFTDIAHALNEVFFEHIKDSAPRDKHHIMVASDGRPDPFPDYMPEGQRVETFDQRVTDFFNARSIDRFNGLRKTDKFRERNEFKLRVHERRFATIAAELLEHRTDVRVLLFPPDALEPEDQRAIREFLLNTGGNRITTKSIPSSGSMADHLIKELLAIGPKAGFHDIYSWRLKASKTTADTLVGEDVFEIPPMPLSEVFLLARWNSQFCGNRMPGGPNFFFDVDVFSKENSSKRRRYRVVVDDKDAASGRHTVHWKGFLAELDLQNPEPGLWGLRLAVPRAKLKPECFDFDLNVIGRFPEVFAAFAEFTVGHGANCGGPDGNQYEIHLDVSSITRTLKSGSLELYLKGLFKARRRRSPADEGRKEIEIERIDAQPLNETSYYLCLPSAVWTISETWHPIAPGFYTLHLQYRSPGQGFSQVATQYLDVKLKGVTK